MTFQLFDPDSDLRITARNLPHWYQPGVTYFVTFRLADSLPRGVLDLWHRRRDDWLARHGITRADENWKRRLDELPLTQQHEFHSSYSREYMDYLDRGYGSCVLRQPECSQEVASSLLHFDGARYHMGDFVVMPNHVHLLVGLIGETDLEKQCYSWKKFTAAKINRLLGRTGEFWQTESFDHLVRSPEQFEYFRSYIATNPEQAGLSRGEYHLYQCPLLQSSRAESSPGTP